MTLLDLIFTVKDEYEITLTPVHINHLLRDSSTEEAERLSKEVLQRYGLNLIVLSSNVKKIAKERKIGIEECGREIRKKFFECVADKVKATKIALGHNMDDQAETIIFRTIRGTGIRGLAGMSLSYLRYIRPLLFAKKDEIRTYAEKRGLFFIEDSSNYETCYDRNVIRHKILPELNKINEKATVHIAELSKKCSEIVDYVSNTTSSVFEKNVLFKNSSFIILKADFLSSEGFIAKEVLRTIYEQFTGSISGIEAFHVEKFYEGGRVKSFFKVQFPRDVVFVKSSDIIFVSKKDLSELNYEISVAENNVVLPFDLGRFVVTGEVEGFVKAKLRGFREGDIYRGKKLKHWLYEAGLPRILRSLVPLLAVGKDVLFVPLFDGNEYSYNEGRKFYKLTFFEGELYSKILKRENAGKTVK
ncbi:MAG: tRNA lysidine(34) synthetase TilS [bacterium]